MKRRILSSAICIPPTALYLTLDLDESCYGVTQTWGIRDVETGREGEICEEQCGHGPGGRT